jgi:hypothetical protein
MTALTALLSVYVLWLLYLAVMNLKRAKDAGNIPRVSLWLGYPILLAGLLIDWLVNVVIFTVLFFDLPGNATELVTGRLKRYAYGEGYGFTWRQRAAHWFAEHLLDPFDPSGKHI